jgi:hypothetical protein
MITRRMLGWLIGAAAAALAKLPAAAEHLTFSTPQVRYQAGKPWWPGPIIAKCYGAGDRLIGSVPVKFDDGELYFSFSFAENVSYAVICDGTGEPMIRSEMWQDNAGMACTVVCGRLL